MENYETYKIIRNKVRKYNALSIVLKCIEKLHYLYRKPIGLERGLIPWELLLLTKIATIEDGNGANDRIADDNDIAHLLNCIKDLTKSNKFLSDKSLHGIYKFLRMTAFQQFWLQEKVTGRDLGCQLLLFSSDDWDYPIKEKFVELLGLDIDAYFQLLIATWVAFEEKQIRLFIDSNWFSPIEGAFEPNAIKIYLSHVSRSYNLTKVYLEELFKESKDFLYQIYEQTPLKKYPLLEINGRYYCYSPNVMNEKMRNFVYDTMKDGDPTRFPMAFGKKFEEYADRCIQYSRVKYYSERDLINMFPGEKVSDFVIVPEDCAVVVEAKAVEMSPVPRVDPTDEKLNDFLKNSIIKAIKQIYSMSKNLRSPQGIETKQADNIYAMIITYKELYLGAGKDAWDEFIQDAVREYIECEGIDINKLLPERIFFVTIDTFEKMVYICRENQNMWNEILSAVVKANLGVRGKKFTFDMHLIKYQVEPLPFVKEEADRLFDNIRSKFLPS